MGEDRRIYLDYNAAAPLSDEAEAAMRPYWHDVFANPASRHQAGQAAWAAIEAAREQIAGLAEGESGETIFTSGATEANFLALLGRFDRLLEEGREASSITVALSSLEHPCVAACGEALKRLGAIVKTIPATREGIVDIRFFDSDDEWDIVSVMAVNHETGAIQPLKNIAEKLRNRRTFFHADAAQWAGRINGGFKQWGVTAISLSAHKMYGPKGIGALLTTAPSLLKPLFPGSQEGGMRGGTVNVPGAVGFGAAAEWMTRNRDGENRRLSRLTDRLWRRLSEQTNVIRTITPEKALPNTLHVRFVGLKGERVVDALDRLGVCCSSGPACASGSTEASAILISMGWSRDEAMEGVRFSLGRFTTENDIEEASDRIGSWLRQQAKHVA
ncbi:MAG: cysteine desulfurase family protein [Candidatus Omnitrophota bacterium]